MKVSRCRCWRGKARSFCALKELTVKNVLVGYYLIGRFQFVD
jgi:hypothetical protein